MKDFSCKFVMDLPDYGDLIPIEEFKECAEYGMFTDDDGNGHWAKDGKMTAGLGDDVCDLDELDRAIDFGVTHVMWFNK